MIPKRYVTARLDGYLIGDRLLEDVMFDVEISINPDEVESPTEKNALRLVSVKLDPDAIPYIKSLGGPGAITHWEREARDCCELELLEELLFEGRLLSDEEERMIESTWE